MSESQQNRIMLDRTIAVILIVVCALLYGEARSYPAGGSYFPLFSLATIITLSTLILIFSFLNKKRPEKEKGIEVKKKKYVRPFILTGIFLLYLVIAPKLGFFFSTAAFTYVVMAFLKIREVKFYLLIVPVLITAFYIFFGMILKVPFPESILK